MVILTLPIPLFVMSAFTGLADGLVRRTVYLAIPISVSPLLILLPCAALLGV